MNIAKVIAQAFKKSGKDLGVRSCQLLKSTPGIRTPGAIASGTNPVIATYAATGLVTDYTAREVDGTLIQGGDRKVLIFGATLPAGITPAVGDRIAIGGETLTIVPPMGATSDPVQAAWQCQCRA